MEKNAKSGAERVRRVRARFSKALQARLAELDELRDAINDSDLPEAAELLHARVAAFFAAFHNNGLTPQVALLEAGMLVTNLNWALSNAMADRADAMADRADAMTDRAESFGRQRRIAELEAELAGMKAGRRTEGTKSSRFNPSRDGRRNCNRGSKRRWVRNDAVLIFPT